jgi:WD40 repeat protein
VRPIKLNKCPRVHSLHYTPDGRRLLAVGGDEVRMVDVAVWVDPQTGAETGGGPVQAWMAAVAPDVRRIARAAPYQSGQVRLAQVDWANLTSSGRWKPVEGLPGSLTVLGLAFTCSNRLAIGYGSPHWVVVHDLDRSTDVCVIRVATYPFTIRFNLTGDRVAVSGGIDGPPPMCVHEVPSGKLLYQFRPHDAETRGLSFDAAGRLVVVNGRRAYVLPPDGPDPLFVLDGHSGQVNAVATSPDGRRLLSASHDGAIRTWDAASGRLAGAFDWGIGPVTALAFAPDGQTCTAAGINGHLVVWDVDE